MRGGRAGELRSGEPTMSDKRHRKRGAGQGDWDTMSEESRAAQRGRREHERKWDWRRVEDEPEGDADVQE